MLIKLGLTEPAGDPAVAECEPPGPRGERRTMPRQSISGPVILPVEIGADGIGVLLNFSTQGAAVHPLLPLRAGSRKRLRWKMPATNEQIDVMGEVVWTDETKLTGIRLVSVPEHARAILKRCAVDAAASPAFEETVVSKRQQLPRGSVPDSMAIAELQSLTQRAHDTTHADATIIVVKYAGGWECVARTGNATLDLKSPAAITCLDESVAKADVVRNVAGTCRIFAGDRFPFRAATFVPIRLPGHCPALIGCLWGNTVEPAEADEAVLSVIAELAALMIPELKSHHPDSETQPQSPAALANQGSCGIGERELTSGKTKLGPVIFNVPDMSPSGGGSHRAWPIVIVALVLIAVVSVWLVGGPAQVWFAKVLDGRLLERVAAHGAISPAAQSEQPAEQPVERAVTNTTPSIYPAPVPAEVLPSVPITPPAIPQPLKAGHQASASSGRQEVALHIINARKSLAADELVPPQLARPHVPVPNLTGLLARRPPVLAASSSASTPLGGMSAATPIRTVSPEYPPAAIQAGREGTVVLGMTIAPDGRVASAVVLRGDDLLGEAAVKAALQWHYRPSEMNGRTIESSTTVTFQFKLTEGEPHQ
jgi:periplasmic protein TonB